MSRHGLFVDIRESEAELCLAVRTWSRASGPRAHVGGSVHLSITFDHLNVFEI